MAVHVFEATQEDRQYIETRRLSEDLRFCEEPLISVSQAARIGPSAEVVSIFAHSRLTAGMIDAMPGLRLIAVRSTTTDMVDLDAASAKGVAVSNVPDYAESTVAEHTFGLILSLTRNIHRAAERVASGQFSLSGLQGRDLAGRTLGVVGAGRIGRRVARIGRAFDMDVLAYDPAPNPEAAASIGYTYTDLQDLLRRSDIVTLHASSTAATYHLIGEHNIRLMRRGALLINTARGELIDTFALLKALDDKRLAGAGLDVLEGEADLTDDALLRADDAITREQLQTTVRNLALLRRHDLLITPHIAFDSKEAFERILDATIGNILAFRRGAPTNLVLPEVNTRQPALSRP